jgi:phosphoserine phosphatase RsbU/P
MITIDHSAPVRLLLVDDDDIDRRAVITALSSIDRAIRVVESADATNALTRIEKEDFDCVLADLVMPGRDGRWLLEQLRANAIDLPFIILTGKGDEEIAVEMMKAGATDYLPKSAVSPTGLSQSIRLAIRVHASERELARSTKAMQESEELLRLALDATDLGIWSYRKDDASFTCDERSKTLLGLPLDSNVDFDLFVGSLHTEDRAPARAALDECMRSGSGIRCDVECRTASGERWIRMTGQAFSSAAGVDGLIGSLQDVSHVRRQRDDARMRAEFAEQMLGIVSHDLRNPISTIVVAADALRRQSQLDGRSTSMLARIISSGERAVRMIRDLLDFTKARIGGGLLLQRRPSNLHEIASEVVDEVRLAFRDRKINLETVGDGNGNWDPDRIAQVYGNLLTNALTYSRRDTEVRIRVSGSAQGVTIEVHNEGDPISENVIAILFEPFKRGVAEPGTPARSVGLGLFIVREVVMAHGGNVCVHSTAHDGTTFLVQLPREIA